MRVDVLDDLNGLAGDFPSAATQASRRRSADSCASRGTRGVKGSLVTTGTVLATALSRAGAVDEPSHALPA